MFERYTEPARRAIFFARYEAAAAGSSHIEPWHLLFGLLREEGAFAGRIGDLDALRREFTAPEHPPVAASVDLPMSLECKRALAVAAAEAETLSHRHIGPQHLLAGLIRASDSPVARALEARGITWQSLHEELARSAPEAGAPEAPSPEALDLSLRLHELAKESARVAPPSSRAALHALVDGLPEGAVSAATAILTELQAWPGAPNPRPAARPGA